jgi:hypothetical protein
MRLSLRVLQVVFVLAPAAPEISGSVDAEESPPATGTAAIVQIGGCSGVCVDKTGLILTAKHCDLQPVERVRFADFEVVAVRIFEADESEGPVVYDCVGSDYPSLSVAEVKPEPGEAVRTFGYPDEGGVRRLKQAEGSVLTGGSYRFRGGRFQGNMTDMPLSEGWSGGPLLNSAREVVGLATCTGDSDSVFVSHAAVSKAYAASLQLHRIKPPLEIRLDLYDESCLAFLHDYAEEKRLRDELQEHYRITVVNFGREADRPSDNVLELPVFLVSGARVASGYRGKTDLLMRLSPHVEKSAAAASDE